MIREFKREEMRINSESKKIKKDLERMIKKGEPKVYIRAYLKELSKNHGPEFPQEAEDAREI